MHTKIWSCTQKSDYNKRITKKHKKITSQKKDINIQQKSHSQKNHNDHYALNDQCFSDNKYDAYTFYYHNQILIPCNIVSDVWCAICGAFGAQNI